jgi:hypothetical protein
MKSGFARGIARRARRSGTVVSMADDAAVAHEESDAHGVLATGLQPSIAIVSPPCDLAEPPPSSPRKVFGQEQDLVVGQCDGTFAGADIGDGPRDVFRCPRGCRSSMWE